MTTGQSIGDYYRGPVFERLNDLEKTVREVDGLARAILLLAASFDDPAWRPAHTIGGLILDRSEEIEKVRCELIDLTHPKWQRSTAVAKRNAA